MKSMNVVRVAGFITVWIALVVFDTECNAQGLVKPPDSKGQHPIGIGQDRAEHEAMIRELVSSGKNEEAWSETVRLLNVSIQRNNPGYQLEDLTMLMDVALCGLREGAVSNKPIAIAMEHLDRIAALLRKEGDMPSVNLNLAWMEARMVNACCLAASLAFEKDDASQARKLLKKGSEFAQRCNFGRLAEETYGTQHREVVWTLIRDLVALRENDEAMLVLEHQWEFVHKPLSLPMDAAVHKLPTIHALAGAEMADILRSRGNIPDAAKYYSDAMDCLEKLRSVSALADLQEVATAHKEVQRRMLAKRLYGPWSHLEGATGDRQVVVEE